jgi:peptide/nickel transport system substrate-binding protein
MIRTLACIAVLLCCGISTGEARTLRLAVHELPPGRGYPYRVMTMPSLYSLSAIFDGLTRIDKDGIVRPWLAKTWTLKDPLTWVLSLRDDVVFHNGRPFTADAVVHAVTYLTGQGGTGEAVATEMSFLKGATALDDFTVKIKTYIPVPILPRFLPVLHIVEPESWTALGRDEFSLRPVGTGPFKVDAFEATRILLRANPESWRPPKLDHLEILAVPDATARVQGLTSGSLDVALALGPDDQDAIERVGGTLLGWRSEMVRTISFVLTEGPSPLDDIRVRRALNLAIDRETIIEGLLGGLTVPASQGATPAAEGYNPTLEPIPYDPDRARTLLEDAGYENGFALTAEAVIGANGSDSAMYQLVARSLREVGVELIIAPVTIAHLFDHFERGKWHGKAFGMVYTMEPIIDVIRTLRNNSCDRPAPWYCDTGATAMIENALTEQNPEKRIALKQHLMARYRDNAAAIFLWPELRFTGLAAGVTGYRDAHGFVSYDTLDIQR